MLREGWQAVPAARAPSSLWLSRHGSGVRSFLVVGNPATTPHSARLTVDCGCLGRGHFLFSDYAGKPLTVTSSGDTAALDLGGLPPHGHAITRALVQVETGRATTLTGSASCTTVPLATGAVQAQWTLSRAEHGRVTVNLPDGATPLSLTINGRTVTFRAVGKAVRYTGALPPRAQLKLTYRPRVSVAADEAALLAFPFVGDGEATAVIELSAEPTDQDRFTARRDAGKPVVALTGRQGPTSVALEGSRLVLSGATTEAREAAMLRLLSLLDREYECYGGLPSTPAFQKAGLAGKTLP
jgi:hypothetical protein